MSLLSVNSYCVPAFFHSLDNHCSGSGKIKPGDLQTILEELFIVAAERGLNDDEFSLVVRFFCDKSTSIDIKRKLLPNMVPSAMVPTSIMRQFMVWFNSNYTKMNKTLCVYILQWVIGLLENDLVEGNVIDIFYFDFYAMLHHKDLLKYVCKLLCNLTKPHDVTTSAVNVINEKQCGDCNDKFLLAVLNIFKGYKPALVPENVRRVDINEVLRSVPQKMDSLMRLTHRRLTPHINKLGGFEIQHKIAIPLHEGQHKSSSLAPFPVYSLEGLDKLVACYPDSIEEAFYKFMRIPVPQNLLSLLRNQTGFFLLMYRGTDFQKQFSDSLFITLQGVLVDQITEADEDDIGYLMARVFQLETFMQQGICCLSKCLAGYLLNWDGFDYRTQVLSLIEWSTFDSFEDLSANILRPLYMMFVSCNITMKREILRTGTNLIKNMLFADVARVSEGLPYPFLKKAPRWISNPLAMLLPLIQWMEQLIKVGICMEPENSILLMQCIDFYETMNVIEFHSNLPMWTVISGVVVYNSLLNITPLALGRVCHLLLRYHKEFLPHLRLKHPEFYNDCRDQINLTSKYAQELMNGLWNGQAVTRKEDGIVFQNIPEEWFQHVNHEIDLDTAFDLAHNITFLPYLSAEEKKHGPNFFQTKEACLALLDYYIEDIAAFVRHFSPNDQLS